MAFLGKRKSKGVDGCFRHTAETESYALCSDVVEAAGVEPASENIFTRASPSAVYGQNSRLHESTNNLTDLVASLCMPAAKLTQVTFTAKSRPIPCRSTHGQDGSFN